MQFQQQARRLVGFWRMPEIFVAQISETKLFRPGHLPQKIEIDFFHDTVGIAQQFERRRRRKLQQHILRLHLGAFAALHLDLICLALLRQNDARLEVAGFFKK